MRMWLASTLLLPDTRAPPCLRYHTSAAGCTATVRPLSAARASSSLRT